VFKIEIKDLNTGEVVKTMTAKTERAAERITMGVLINLDQDNFCVSYDEE
jgi:hypothetical protein